MKTKGRFIAILAILGLLLVMIPIGPVGAATGVVTLDKTYYSDKDTFNIVTASVEDSDLSAARVGTARYNVTAGAVAADGQAPDPFTLKDTGGNSYGVPVLGGDKAKSETFNSDGVLTSSATTAPTTAVTTFTLNKRPRDHRTLDPTGVGVFNHADVQVVVSGTTLTPTTQYTVTATSTTKTVTLATAPAVGTGNVVISYEYSEYDQATPANTPIRSFGTSVKYGTTLAGASSEALLAAIDNTAGTLTTIGDVPANQVVVVTFVYDVKDTISNNVTFSSNTSIAAGKNRAVSGVETTAASNVFTSKVALFTAADLAKIESESGDATNDATANGGNNDGKVQVVELNNTSGLGAALNTRLLSAAGSSGLGLTLTATGTLASDLLKQLLPVADADTITATYVDASPSATLTKTALADLAAPTVTLVAPADKLYTGETLLTLTADVVDTGAGVDTANISPTVTALVAPSGVTGNTIAQPIASGYRISFAPGVAMTEGAKTWFIAVMDKVGNTPARDDTTTTTVNEGARGAAPAGAATADNPFQLTVDTAGPTVVSATTGLYLKNPGVTTGDDTSLLETQSTNKRTWVRLLFDLGTGGAPIDTSTVAASDFRVAGVQPLSVLVNAKSQESGAVKTGSAVYLEVAELDTDAKPKVELVGEIKDKAGNARTSGTISAAVDQLSPVLTATPSAALSQKTLTITVTSSEALVVNPTIETTATEPAAGTVTGTTAQTVTSTGTKSWTATFTNTSGAASKQYIVVSGTDLAGNTSKIGDDLPVTTVRDLTSFEVDYAAPTVVSPAATGTASAGTVWITVEYDEAEYTGDSYKTVTVTSATLDGVDVKADLFTSSIVTGGETHATVTLPKVLAKGTYEFKISVTDSAGNTTSVFTHTLTVSAKPTFDLVLKPGVNLISIPGDITGDGANINNMFKDLPVTAVVTYDAALNKAGKNPWLTSTYDAATKTFKGDIAVLAPGKAYFVTASARTTVKLDIASVGTALPPIVQVLQGYNAIGFSSIQGTLSTTTTADLDGYLNSIKWSVAYTFDPTPGVGWTVLRPDGTLTGDTRAAAGTGYLVYVTQDGTLTP